MDQLGLQFLQPRLGLLLLGEIADEACKERLPSRMHLADGEMHRKCRAVLAHAGDDAPDADDAPFARLEVAGDVSVMTAAIRLRHQLADVLPDRLGFAVAELTLGGAGVELHDAMLVDHDHRIRNRIQDRAKVALARPDCVLKALLTVDVDHDAAEPGRGTIGTVDGRANRTHPVPLIRMPVHPILNVEIASGCDRLLHGICRSVAILGIEQGKEEVEVDRGIRFDAEELAGGGRPVQCPARQIEIPGADARSLGAAARVRVERILISKGTVGVDHASPCRLLLLIRYRIKSGV
jgi:hypothetical protein